MDKKKMVAVPIIHLLGGIYMFQFYQALVQKKLVSCFFIVVVLCVTVLLILFAPMVIHNYRMRSAICQNGLRMVRIIGNAVSKYAQEHNQIPYAEQWSNVIIENSPGISTNDFKIPQFNRVDCAVALNQYLSGADVNELPGNVVLLFEADGLMNLTGDSELLLSTREKDAYFGSLLAEDRFAYIYFVDGTIAKFRLHDGGIAIYSRSTGKFGPYVTKGSKYIPLIWKTRF